MPSLADIGIIAAETTRSRAYVQALVQHGLLPSFALVLRNRSSRVLPGQGPTDAPGGSGGERPGKQTVEGVDFDTTESLDQSLDAAGIPTHATSETDVHSAEITDLLRARPETVFIYSGFGGVILRPSILGIGKRFLHVHGGYLPDYKGSTTNYYSLIKENLCGASSIFLTQDIDGGPILMRRRFSAPPDRTRLDYLYDSLIRARILVDTIQSYVTNGDWVFEGPRNHGGETYYIIHPLLRHVAILAK